MCVGKAIARFCPIYKRFNKNSFRSKTVFIIDYHSFHCNIFPFSDFSCQTVFHHSVFTSVYIAKLRYEIGNSSPSPGRPGFGRFPVSPGPAPGFRPPCPAAYCSSARSWGCRPDSACRGTSPTCRIVYSSCLLSGKYLSLNTNRVYNVFCRKDTYRAYPPFRRIQRIVYSLIQQLFLPKKTKKAGFMSRL